MINKIVSIVLIIVFVSFAWLFVIHELQIYQDKEKISEQKTIELERDNYLKRSNEQKLKMEEKVHQESLNLYEKITEQLPIRILVIGNESFEEDSRPNDTSQWMTRFISGMDTKYNVNAESSFIDLNYASVARAWFLITQKKDLGNYDLILLDLTNSSEDQLNIENFSFFYDQMIQYIITTQSKMEIFSVINSNSYKVASYLKKTEEINSYYDIEIIDTFNLTSENIVIELLAIIDHEIKTSVKSLRVKEPMFQIKDQIQSSKIVIPSRLTHIGRQDKMYYSETNLSTIEYQSDASSFIFNYYKFDTGGIIRIYIDEKMIKEIETYNEYIELQSIILECGPGVKDIKVEMISKTLKEETVIVMELIGLY